MAHFGGSQGAAASARTLPRLDMNSLQANLPAVPPSSSSAGGTSPYNVLARPRPSFSSSSGGHQASSSSSNPSPDLASAFSPYSPPAVPSKLLPRTGMEEQYSSWDQSQQRAQGQPLDSRPPPTPSASSVKSPTSATGKRPNPLEDLILTETDYVADLGAIIKVSEGPARVSVAFAAC